MSQDYTSTSKKRRAARAHRNRPVLVTSTSVEQSEADAQEKELTTEAASPTEEPVPVKETPSPAISRSASMVQRMRKLPGFFSTVGKSEQEATKKEVDVAQARLARATRGKATAQSSQPATKDDTPVETKAARPAATSKTSSTPTRSAPPSTFKTRYILGMGIYLLGANLLGGLEQQLLRAYHLDMLLTTLNLFGAAIPVYTSTVLFLASLVVLLILLGKLDLIPRFSPASGASAQRSAQSQRGTGSGESSRSPQPTMRQGVKGADDKLYQEYRANQRREKKR